MNGTPKTLLEAIKNGIMDSSPADHGLTGESIDKVAEAIAPHVCDYLANKFAAAMMKPLPPTEDDFHNEFGILYRRITNAVPETPPPMESGGPTGMLSSAIRSYRILKG